MKLHPLAFSASCLVLLLGAAGSYAQSSSGPAGAPGGLRPDRGELEGAGSAQVAFVNYEGPAARIDSAAEIVGIGAALGRELRSSGRSAGGDRYRVVRAVDPSAKGGLDADIIVLGKDAEVDHIRNLRRIVAGYLSSAWGYSDKDAATLAVFVTVYNAVHRGDMKYFGSKYKEVVLKELTAEDAGLALNYSEWPGKSRIVVPLSAGAAPGSLGAVDTGAVSEKKVVESLKAQPDKGVPDRQALVDVKEREASQKQAEADKKQAEAAAAERKLAEDKAKVEKDRAELEAAKASAGKPAAAPSTAPSAEPAAAPAGAPGAAPPTTGGGQAAGAAAPELAEKETAVAAEESSVKAQETQVAAKKAEAAQAQAQAQAKKDEAAADRKGIASDQKQAIAEQVAAKGVGEAAGVFLVKVGDDPSHLARIVFVDAESGAGIRASRITTIHTRSLSELPDAFFAAAGLEGKPGGVKFVKLDKASLENVAESAAEAFGESAVLVKGDAIYAVVSDGGKQYLARLSASDLSEKARSKEAVAPFGLIAWAAGGVAVQPASGSGFLVLKPDSLEKAKDLVP